MFFLRLVFITCLWVGPILATQRGSIQQTAPAAPLFKIDMFGWAYSNALSDWNGRTPKADGTPGDPVEIVTQMTLHRPFFGPFNVTFTPQFGVRPFLGERFVLKDATVGMQGVVYQSGGFTYWARYELVTPLTQASRDQGMIITPQSINSISYLIGNSRFRIDGVAVPNISFMATGVKSFAYLSPRLNYLVNDSFWFVTMAEFLMVTQENAGLFNLEMLQPMNIGFGFRYLSLGGRGMWVQPLLDVFPSGNVASNARVSVMFGGPIL